MEIDQVIDFFRKHKAEINERFNANVIAVFGSYARNEQTADSDLDILYEIHLG